MRKTQTSTRTNTKYKQKIKKILSPKTREATDQMVTTANNQDVHDEILLRHKTGALSRSPTADPAPPSKGSTGNRQSFIRAELLAHPLLSSKN